MAEYRGANVKKRHKIIRYLAINYTVGDPPIPQGPALVGITEDPPDKLYWSGGLSFMPAAGYAADLRSLR